MITDVKFTPRLELVRFIREEAMRLELDPRLALAVARVESRLNPYAMRSDNQWLLLVLGFEYLDYVSWDGVSKLPAIVRVYKDEKIHKELAEKGLAFLARLDKAREQGVTTKKPKVTPKKVMA